MARIKDLVRLLFCSCVCRVSWCCFYFLFMSSNGSIVESGASLLTTFYFTAFLLFAEERIRDSVQKGQQHLQHRRHHLRHQRGERPGFDDRLQERRRTVHQTPLSPQNGRPVHGGQEVLQPRQQSGQDIAHHFPRSVLHLQLGLLGHIRQQKARDHEGQQPKLNLTKCKA